MLSLKDKELNEFLDLLRPMVILIVENAFEEYMNRSYRDPIRKATEWERFKGILDRRLNAK